MADSNNSHLETFNFYDTLIPTSTDFNKLQGSVYDAMTRIQGEFISEGPRPDKIPILSTSGFTVTVPAGSGISLDGVSTNWEEAISFTANTATAGNLQGTISPGVSSKRYSLLVVKPEIGKSDLRTTNAGSEYYENTSITKLYVYQTATDVALSDDYSINAEVVALVSSIESDDNGVVLAICEIKNGAISLQTQDTHPTQYVMFPAGGPVAETDQVRSFLGHSNLATVLSSGGTVALTSFAVSGAPGSVIITGGESVMLTVPDLGANKEFRSVRSIEAILPAATFNPSLNNENYVIRAKWNDSSESIEVYMGTGDYPNDPNSLPFASGSSGGTNLGYRRTLVDLPLATVTTGSDGILPVVAAIPNHALSELDYILPIVETITNPDTVDVALSNDYSVSNRSFSFPADLDTFLQELTTSLNPVLKSGAFVSTMSDAYAQVDSGLMPADSMIQVSGLGSMLPWETSWSIDTATAGLGNPVSLDSDGEKFYCAFDDQIVRALSSDSGNILWSSADIGSALSLITTDGESVFVYAASPNTIYKLSASDGSLQATLVLSGVTALHTDGSNLYIASANGQIHKYLYNLSGSDLWSIAAVTSINIKKITTNGKYLVYVSDYHAATTSNVGVVALSTGSVLYRRLVAGANDDQKSCVFTADTLLIAGDTGLIAAGFGDTTSSWGYRILPVAGDGVSSPSFIELAANNNYAIVVDDSATPVVYLLSLKGPELQVQSILRTIGFVYCSASWDKLLLVGDDPIGTEDMRATQVPVFPATFRVSLSSETYRYPIVGKLMTGH